MLKKLVFILGLTAVATTSFAATAQIKNSVDTKLSVTGALGKKIADSDVNIQPFDFDKLMSEAERYYKAAKEWKKIKCSPKTGFLCNKWECNKRPSSAYLILDKKEEKITRCEDEICESYDADFEQTGVFINIQAKGPIGSLIRVLGDSRYKEITTVGLDAYIANGSCEVVSEKE